MPRRKRVVDSFEPFDHTVKVRFSSAQVDYLNQVAAAFGLSRAWLLRRCIFKGIGPVVADLQAAARAAQVPRPAMRPRPAEARPRRGPRGVGTGPFSDIEVFVPSSMRGAMPPRMPFPNPEGE